MRTRYRQVKREDGTYEMVRVDSTAPRHVVGINAGDFAPYRSPIDGTVVRTQRQHEDHKKRYGVVEHREFGTEHWDAARKRRERLYKGEHTTAEKQARKMEINEVIERLARQ